MYRVGGKLGEENGVVAITWRVDEWEDTSLPGDVTNKGRVVHGFNAAGAVVSDGYH